MGHSLTMNVSLGKATIFTKGTRNDINGSSSMFKPENWFHIGIGHSCTCNPLALACSGMLPLFNASSYIDFYHPLYTTWVSYIAVSNTKDVFQQVIANFSVLACSQSIGNNCLLLRHAVTTCDNFLMLVFGHASLPQANLYTVSTSVSDAPFLAMHARICSCLHTVSADILDALLLAVYAWFCSSLHKISSCVSIALLVFWYISSACFL